MRFHCPVLNVLLFHPFIESSYQNGADLYRSISSSIYLCVWRLPWEVVLQKAEQELYTDMFLLEGAVCKCSLG